MSKNNYKIKTVPHLCQVFIHDAQADYLQPNSSIWDNKESTFPSEIAAYA